MAFKKDNKIKSNFNRISIGLASPEGKRFWKGHPEKC